MSWLGDLLGALGIDGAGAIDNATAQAQDAMRPEKQQDPLPVPMASPFESWMSEDQIAHRNPMTNETTPSGVSAEDLAQHLTDLHAQNEGKYPAVHSRAVGAADAQEVQARLAALKSMSSPDSLSFVAKGSKTAGTNEKTGEAEMYDPEAGVERSYDPATTGTFSHSNRPAVEQSMIQKMQAQHIEPAVAGSLIDSGGLNGARGALLELAKQQAEPMSNKIMKVLGVASSLKNPAQAQMFAVAMLRQYGLQDADIAHLLSKLPAQGKPE